QLDHVSVILQLHRTQRLQPGGTVRFREVFFGLNGHRKERSICPRLSGLKSRFLPRTAGEPPHRAVAHCTRARASFARWSPKFCGPWSKSTTKANVATTKSTTR